MTEFFLFRFAFILVWFVVYFFRRVLPVSRVGGRPPLFLLGGSSTSRDGVEWISTGSATSASGNARPEPEQSADNCHRPLDL